MLIPYSTDAPVYHRPVGTIGLIVINALVFWAAAGLLEGFGVTGFGAAMLGSMVYTVFGMFIDSALQRLFPPQLL